MEISTQQISSTVYEPVKQTIIHNITKKLLNTLQPHKDKYLNKCALQDLLSHIINYNHTGINEINNCREKLNL
jgi:hypothetical protein